MSTIRNPVGPQPTNVYWRRRLIVLGGLALLIVIILLIVFAPKGGDAPTDTKSSTPPASSESTDDDEAASGDPAACTSAVLAVSAVTDADSYPANQNPMISLSITNNGVAACTINAGTDAQVYTITSGADLIWTSTDCQTDATPAEIVLEPGASNTQSTTPFSWDRTRSSTSTCDSPREPVAAGGATYRLAVSLGDIEASEDKPFILN